MKILAFSEQQSSDNFLHAGYVSAATKDETIAVVSFILYSLLVGVFVVFYLLKRDPKIKFSKILLNILIILVTLAFFGRIFFVLFS